MTNETKTILITGAGGNLGNKSQTHLHGKYPLRLIDKYNHGNNTIKEADLSVWHKKWINEFHGVHTVVHFAADPDPNKPWDALLTPNIDVTINVFTASVMNNVKRIIFASSNHVMGGYKDISKPEKITTELPPLPGTHYTINDRHYDSTPYGSAKLMAERLGKCYSEIYGITFVAARIGWVLPGSNQTTADIPKDCDEWLRLMWLSNRDFCNFMERCIESELTSPFVILNAMSANSGMRWDIEYTKKIIGYNPVDDVMQ